MLTDEHVKKLLHGAILYQGDKIIGKISVCKRRDFFYYEYDCVYFCQNIEIGNSVAMDKLGFTYFKILSSLHDFTTGCNTLSIKLESNSTDLISFINIKSKYTFRTFGSKRRSRITNIILQHQATLYDFV